LSGFREIKKKGKDSGIGIASVSQQTNRGPKNLKRKRIVK
jgi:hypothetical protein